MNQYGEVKGRWGAQVVPFIVSLCTAVVSHRKPAASGIPRDSCRVQAHHLQGAPVRSRSKTCCTDWPSTEVGSFDGTTCRCYKPNVYEMQEKIHMSDVVCVLDEIPCTKTNWGMEVQLQAFFTSALDGRC